MANAISGNAFPPLYCSKLYPKTNPQEKNQTNKAHSTVVSHQFVGNLLGVDVMGRMNCSVCCRKNVQSKHSSRELIFSICKGKGKKMRKRRSDCWWMRHLAWKAEDV